MAPVMKPKVVISQDGFDGAVKENMEDFDMSLAEAVEDAIKTFQMQGANLSGQDTWMDEWMRAFFVHCVVFYGDFECGDDGWAILEKWQSWTPPSYVSLMMRFRHLCLAVS